MQNEIEGIRGEIKDELKKVEKRLIGWGNFLTKFKDENEKIKSSLILSIHNLDKKVDRAIYMTIENEHNIKMLEKKMHNIPEDCPHRHRLDAHLEQHRADSEQGIEHRKTRISKVALIPAFIAVAVSLGGLLFTILR